jgi:ABC-type nitrate/sulfonate/bicarbonate transport system substrate-binding protein
MLLLFLALLISSLVPAPGRGAEPPSKAGFAYGAINAYMAKLNMPFQATGMVTTRKILESNEQMVERVARANVDAVNYIRSPENKKSVLQTMSKNFKVANPERIEACVPGHRGRTATQHLSDDAGGAVGSQAHGGTGDQSKGIAGQNQGGG